MVVAGGLGAHSSAVGVVAGGEVGELDRVGGARVEELGGVGEEGVGFVVGGFEAGEVLLWGC